jgi:hypothetical protein
VITKRRAVRFGGHRQRQKEHAVSLAISQPRSAVLPSRSVLYGVLTLAGMSVVGAGISVAGDLSPNVVEAMGPEGRLSIPWPMTLFQIAMAVAAGSRRRWLALLGSAAIAAALLAGVVSGFYDGGYADDRLGTFERGYQVMFVVALGVVGAVAVTRFWRALRGTTG